MENTSQAVTFWCSRLDEHLFLTAADVTFFPQFSLQPLEYFKSPLTLTLTSITLKRNSPYRAVKTFCLGYENQSVSSV